VIRESSAGTAWIDNFRIADDSLTGSAQSEVLRGGGWIHNQVLS